MFTALILACSVDLSSCRSFVYPLPLPDEETCMSALAEGISNMESQGLTVKGYHCYQWPKDT